MGEPQPILTPLTPAAIFLIVTIDDGGDAVVRDVLEDVSGLVRSIGFRVPASGLVCVTSIGSAAWDRLFSGPRPAELHEFRALDGGRHHAPATPGDVLFHIRANALDVCFEVATKITERLAGAATVVDDTNGFRYFEQRDLLGFVDGTENPVGYAAPPATLVGEDDAAFAGGSYVIVQKYVHTMADWKSQSTEQQERVIGRTKLDDIELSDETKPVDSHVALTTIVDPDGTERQITRQNMPFGNVKDGVFGTYFIGYSSTPTVTERMLERMFLGDGTAHHDRILDFSVARTGTLFFAPTVEFLDDLPPPPGETSSAAPPPETPRASDGSLGIGSLKRSTKQ
ncbi:Dyp-type peroxidase [Antrihabitans cavernicola]|uniref:Dyp-type peroxidase n=1 Tax=Antrihabitans cavernicola TaxID=2495913 RepID=A0A5A7SEB6_9NOCA|nr:Dyp-type peroxidase [Spelaeibacter cavernicola]KAA0023739.1 Dyp-type peroxidase [Spelaeibacter cavernicola]